ncbi:subclass B1 metallo-beta-lactamase [Muriicola sp. Z0-33]|uniref:subclass B1 metallo-beta-lactamase n=1 Tax=Muriicola sp. Z0-33 TaxID=2816957 RepID=UPI0022389029|nr:subclass B1 metallo-beta-lactamase [Muriicola sp. Z0-33]MCW5516064.1 subclass B1 metallo-beta-lactamase [Muriicola sp. Z0-33]
MDLTYNSETLKIVPVSENSYVHVSNLRLSNGAVFACNGLIYVNDGAAVIFDTPTDIKTTEKLITLLTVSNKLKIVGLVVNHYHDDCLAGIAAFHKREIPTYASQKTVENINEQPLKPKNTFDTSMTLNVGKGEVINRYFGEAHTADNIVSYLPGEELLFGGCMIKSIDATKGNLNDANLEEWSNTVSRIKDAYPNLKIVIPGHGDFGNTALLDYTIQLFSSP